MPATMRATVVCCRCQVADEDQVTGDGRGLQTRLGTPLLDLEDRHLLVDLPSDGVQAVRPSIGHQPRGLRGGPAGSGPSAATFAGSAGLLGAAGWPGPAGGWPGRPPRVAGRGREGRTALRLVDGLQLRLDAPLVVQHQPVRFGMRFGSPTPSTARRSDAESLDSPVAGAGGCAPDGAGGAPTGGAPSSGASSAHLRRRASSAPGVVGAPGVAGAPSDVARATGTAVTWAAAARRHYRPHRRRRLRRVSRRPVAISASACPYAVARRARRRQFAQHRGRRLAPLRPAEARKAAFAADASSVPSPAAAAQSRACPGRIRRWLRAAQAFGADFHRGGRLPRRQRRAHPARPRGSRRVWSSESLPIGGANRPGCVVPRAASRVGGRSVVGVARCTMGKSPVSGVIRRKSPQAGIGSNAVAGSIAKAPPAGPPNFSCGSGRGRRALRRRRGIRRRKLCPSWPRVEADREGSAGKVLPRSTGRESAQSRGSLR